MQTIKVNGATLHFTKTGQGEPLLFIPGSISDYRTWSGISEHFADTYTCYTISRRFQYPASYSPGADSSVAANTEDIAAFIKAEKLAPVRVVGHSFGGYIALNLAIQHPQLVKKVVAEEPIFAPALVKNPKNPLELLGLLIKNGKAGKSFARLGMKGIEPTFKALAKGDTTKAQVTFIDGVTGGRKTPATLDALTRQQLSDNIAALSGEDPFNNTLKMEDLAHINCEVLLASGEESPYVFQYINEQLHKRIKRSKLQQIQGADHWIHISRKNDFIQAVNSFLL